jgi:hypothetical protein
MFAAPETVTLDILTEAGWVRLEMTRLQSAAAIANIASAWTDVPTPTQVAAEQELAGPRQEDVNSLRELLDLITNFSDNDQRARYLLSSNWLRDFKDALRSQRA